MSTLTALKARIADDIARSDLTSQIANAISDSITYYKNKRFYFNETRSATFATVDGQSSYSSSDDADIPLFNELDEVFLETSTSKFRLRRRDPKEVEFLLDPTASEGQPTEYSYFARNFRLYPTPDAVYTIRPMGFIEVAAPATDDEADNVWMVNCFELLRCHAKVLLYIHVIKSTEQAALFSEAERAALAVLRQAGGQRMGIGRIESTDF